MDAHELELDYSEIYRYLGYREGVPEGEVRHVVEQCAEDLASQAELRSVARRFPLKLLGDNRFLIGDMKLGSRALSRNMRDRGETYLMAATIGFTMGRLAARAVTIGRMSRAVIYQAAGAMLTESYYNALNRKLKEEAAAESEFLRPRFSPGCGDLPLAIQPELFRALEIQKHTGITLTENLLMMPIKSVTALTSVSPEDSRCILQGCESRSRTNYSFRR